MNPKTLVALEALGVGALGAGLTAAGTALLAGTTDWRLILGGAILAAAAKLVPTQVFGREIAPTPTATTAPVIPPAAT